MNTSQLGVVTGAGGKLTLNTENGVKSTISQEGGLSSSNLRKKMKPYKSNQTRRMPENPSSNGVK